MEILLEHFYCFEDDKSSIKVCMMEDENDLKFIVICKVEYPNKNEVAMNDFNTYEDALLSYTALCGWARKCIEANRLLNVFEICDLKVL